MKCPFCGFADSKVVDSRPTDEDLSIRRRRECLSCGKRFTTYETVEKTPVLVVKRDKSRQAFDRDKLLRGLMRACEKRPISMETLEKVVSNIETRVQGSLDREVTSEQIGEYAMEELKSIDKVAYVRFSSVYRDFKDITSFRDTIAKLLDE
ncbi:MAG: transcriptional regulator NrdR [Clostridia bacterium]|nr:transcriptional regulator NrdR [Clostridia bacterium]